MAHADVLYDFVLMVAKFVKIAIDSGKIHILVKVVFQIFHRSSLARWICQTGFHKLAELFIVNTIETNPVKRAVQYQVASVEKDVADIGQTRRTSSRSRSHASRSSPYRSSCGWRRDSSLEIHL